MTAVVGVDPSLTAAGIAIIASPATASTPNVPRVFTTGTDPSGPDLMARATRIDRQVLNIVRCMPPSVALVVVEALPQRPPDPAQASWFVERGALILALTSFLVKRRIPVAEVNLGTLKKWATGDGSAAKLEVHAALSELWPRANLCTHTGKPDDNKSDSLALATMGAQQLGWWPPELTHHIAPNVRWPKEITRV